MTVRNIQSGFQVTGIFPLDRKAIGVSSPNAMSLPQETGLAFIPLYSSPTPRPLVRQQEELSVEQEIITENDVALFERRFGKGYDLDFDHRYCHIHCCRTVTTQSLWY